MLYYIELYSGLRIIGEYEGEDENDIALSYPLRLISNMGEYSLSSLVPFQLTTVFSVPIADIIIKEEVRNQALEGVYFANLQGLADYFARIAMRGMGEEESTEKGTLH